MMFGLSTTHTAVLALIIANIIWGATPPIFKWALEDITPFTLAFLRFSIATLILIPFVRHHNLKIDRQDWPKLFTLAFGGIFLHISFFFLGLELSSSINAPIIASAAPVFLMLAGIIILKERPGVKRIGGGFMSLVGVSIIVLLPVLNNSQGVGGSILGNFFFIMATLGAVLHVVLLKGLSEKYDPMPLIFWSFAIASVMFFPIFTSQVLSGSLANVGLQGFIGVAFGAVLASATAYYLFYWAIKYLLASEVGLFTYLDPVVAIIIAGPLLGEHPTSTYVIGSILVFLGIYIAEGRIHYHPIHLFRR